MAEAMTMARDAAQRSGAMLEIRGLQAWYGESHILHGLDLDIREGEVVTLLGRNGAGKTTCFNLLTNFLPPTRGTIHYDGRDITGMKPAEVARLGLVRSFQISAVFSHLTVLENVRLALQRARGASFDFWRSERPLKQYDGRAMELLEDVGLTAYAKLTAGELPYGRKRALEIATTLALEPKMMLLDEPTAGMTHEDVGRIMALVQRVAQGRTVLLVEHNLTVVSGLCDMITVLTRGRVLAEGPYACLLYTSPSPRDLSTSRMPSSA